MVDDNPKRNEKWIGALEHNPPIALALGQYMAEMTAVEMVLNACLGFLTGVRNNDIPKKIFGHIISMGTRLDILKSLAELPENKRWQPQLDKLLSDATKINSRRNAYVHGTYRTGAATQTTELLTWALSENRKPGHEWITPDKIHEDIVRVRTFSGDFMTIFHPDKSLPSMHEPSLETTPPERS